MRVRNELSVESIKKLASPNAECRMRIAEFKTKKSMEHSVKIRAKSLKSGRGGPGLELKSIEGRIDHETISIGMYRYCRNACLQSVRDWVWAEQGQQ